jgi:hypothetical protein
MKTNMDRRDFIQKTGVAALGITGAFLIAQTPTIGEVSASVNQSSNMELERWLLETGRNSLDRNLYTTLAS